MPTAPCFPTLVELSGSTEKKHMKDEKVSFEPIVHFDSGDAFQLGERRRDLFLGKCLWTRWEE